MIKRVFGLTLAAVLLAFSTSPLLSDGTTQKSGVDVSLKAVGLEIKKKNPTFSKYEREEMKIKLQVESKNGYVIAVNTKKSSLAKFGDDKGTDFLSKRARFGRFAWPKGSPDKKAVVFELRSQLTPASGSKTITAEGVLKLVVAQGGPVTQKIKVKFTKGETFKLGSTEVKVHRYKQGKYGKLKWNLTFSMPDATYFGIVKIRFLDGTGKENASKTSGWSRSGGTTWPNWSMASEMKEATLEVTYFPKTSVVDHPFKLSFGLGL